MWFSILILMASLSMISWVFEKINPQKQKLVWYGLDVKKVEFDLEFHHAKVGFFFFLKKKHFLFCLA